MGRTTKLRIKNYRSIRETVNVSFPDRVPLVLIGENNAGKSNIVRALNLLLGESYPGSHEPEDHEYYGRDRDNGPIRIQAALSGVSDHYYGSQRDIHGLTWSFPPEQGERSFVMNLANQQTSGNVSNEIRNQCTCFLLDADRRLSYQLGYSSKYTLLSRLTRKFHDRLNDDADRVARLRDQFERLRETFAEVDHFSSFVGELQTQLQELSGNLAYGLDIDFAAYNPSNFFRSLRIQPSEDGEAREMEELGTGQEQILALSFAYAYARTFHGEGDLLLVIEEPEAHLHPLAQTWVASKIREIAGEGVQVVVTTHSPAFLDITGLDGICLVRKPDDCTVATQLTAPELASFCVGHGAPRASAESILPFYAAAATQEILSGFFARRVVLVEGPTEALALPLYLSKVGLQNARDGVACIPVGGVGNVAKWWRLFTAYGIPTYVVFDNDARDDEDGRRRSDILNSLGVGAAQIEWLMNTDEWVVEDRFTVFGRNFELALGDAFAPSYAALEGQARDDHGLSGNHAKPLVARYVAERIDVNEHELGRDKLMAMRSAIAELAASH